MCRFVVRFTDCYSCPVVLRLPGVVKIVCPQARERGNVFGNCFGRITSETVHLGRRSDILCPECVEKRREQEERAKRVSLTYTTYKRQL